MEGDKISDMMLKMTDYEKILKDAQENPDILGLILLGSRGKGFENEHSDYDMRMIVKDEVVSAIRDKYESHHLENVDLEVSSLSDFKEYAKFGDINSWDRYDFTHTKILIDKTDLLSELVKEKGYIPQDKLSEFIDYWIDGYVNGVFRSVKCIRNGNSFGAHLEAVNSMLDLLTLAFALHGKHRPFLGYVGKELDKHPLEKLPWSSQEFMDKIKKVLETADIQTQQELLMGMERICRTEGHGHMFDGWEGKDKWTMTFKSE